MSSASKRTKIIQETIQKPATFIQYCFYALFFITPLLLWPFTSEVFEFNKMMFVYAMTIIIAAGWAVRSIQQKKFEIARTPLDFPLLIFLSSQVISTVISIDRHTSLWGYYSRFHGGLVSTFCYVILFYALVTHFSGQGKAIRNLIKTILVTAAITSFYAILEKMGVDKHIWVQDVQNRVFSTLGQPNWLSAYLIALLPISLFAAVNTKSINSRFAHIALATLYLLAIFFTKSQSGIGATAIVLLLFTIIIAVQKKQSKILIGLAVLIASLVIIKSSAVKQTLTSLNKINPFFSNSLTIVTEENKTRIGGSDSMAIRRIVWGGALELGKKYPFFGTGVETFGYTYYWVRPAVHNLTSESDFLYNKAHNEYLNFLANTGFIGLFAYLFLIISILRIFTPRHSRPDQESIQVNSAELSTPLLLGFISILITNYFGFSVVNVALFFFLFPAIYLSAINQSGTSVRKINVNDVVGIGVIFLMATWLVFGIRKMWLADLAFTAGRSNLSEDLKAIQLNPREPLYYAQLGNVQSLVAVQIIAPQIQEMTATTPAELRDKGNAYLKQYTNDSINNISKAVQMNKYNLNLLKIKARTELTLGSLDPKYNRDAINTLLKITELSPTEATNYYNIGVLYTNLAQTALETKAPGGGSESRSELESAKLAFQKAIDLKPDYEAAKDKLKLLENN